MSATVIGHMNPDTDSIVSAIAAAGLYTKRGIAADPAAQGAPTPETAFVLDRFGLAAPRVKDDVAGEELFLVDFSDLPQAPANIDKATIMGIVDHHKLGDVTTSAPWKHGSGPWAAPAPC